MQASANPQITDDIRLTPTNFKNVYFMVSQRLMSAEVKKYLRQYFMHLLEPETHDELTDTEKGVLLVGIELLSRKPFLNEKGKKIIKAIKQDIENNGAIFLAVINDDEKKQFLDYINYCDVEAATKAKTEAEQKLAVPVYIHAGRAVNEENGAVNRNDSRLYYLINSLHRQAISALQNKEIRKALMLLRDAYQQAKNISDANEIMRDTHLHNIKSNMIMALKNIVLLYADKGNQYAGEEKFAKAIVAYSEAIKVARIIYKETNDAELLVENQRMLIDAYIQRGKKSEITLQNYDDAILYYRAALVIYRQIPSQFQNTDSINSLLFTIYHNLVSCYLNKANSAKNEADKIKYLKAELEAYHLAFAAHEEMSDALTENDGNKQRFALLQQNYAPILFNLGQLLYNQALAAFNKNEHEKAKALFHEAISLLKTIPIPLKLPVVSFLLAGSHYYLMLLHRSIGMDFYNKEMYQDALKHFNDALKYGERIPPALRNEEAIQKIRECREDRADCYQKLGENSLAETKIIYLIFEYYYRYMPAEELNADIERQDQLATCAVNLSDAWSSLFPPKDAKRDDQKAKVVTALNLSHAK